MISSTFQRKMLNIRIILSMISYKAFTTIITAVHQLRRRTHFLNKALMEPESDGTSARKYRDPEACRGKDKYNVGHP